MKEAEILKKKFDLPLDCEYNSKDILFQGLESVLLSDKGPHRHWIRTSIKMMT